MSSSQQSNDEAGGALQLATPLPTAPPSSTLSFKDDAFPVLSPPSFQPAKLISSATQNRITAIRKAQSTIVGRTSNAISFLLSPVTSLFIGPSISQENSNSNYNPTTIPQQDESQSQSNVIQKQNYSWSDWVIKNLETFGKDAGKTLSEHIKEPLDKIAQSPVLKTGEVVVVHSINVDSYQVKRVLRYIGALYLFMILTKRIVLPGRRGGRLLFRKNQQQQTTPLSIQQ